MINPETLYKISYGLYIVSSGNRQRGNGFISNTVFQVSSEPAKFATCCNKNNFTAQLIQDHAAFSVSILNQQTSAETMGKFGFKSGREFDKMAGSSVIYGETGVPVVLDDCVAWFECRVQETLDVGTHLMFIGELVRTEMIDPSKEVLTYEYYRAVKNGLSPKNAPTFIRKEAMDTGGPKAGQKRYKCIVCGYIYDDAVEEIPFAELPDDWTCPLCGAGKEDFEEVR